MALRLINLSKDGTSISFVSTTNFDVGSPVYFKQLGSGTYSVSGSSPNKTINLTTSSPHGYATGTTVRLFLDFSNETLLNDSYAVNSTTSVNLNVTGQSTSVTGTGTFTYYDFAKAQSNSQSSVSEYVVSNKNVAGTDYAYTAVKIGEVTLTKSQWDAVKESYGTFSGLSPGKSYYLSPTTPGKVVPYVVPLGSPVLKAISKTRAFVDLSVRSVETGVGDTFLRQTFTGDGTTLSFALNSAPAGLDYTTVFVGGVYQLPGDSWSLSGYNVVFTEAPYAGAVVSVQYARSVLLADASAVNKMVCYSEVVTGSPKNTFNVPSTPANLSSTIVFVGGSVQDQSQYYFSGNVLTFYDSVSVGLQVIVYVLNSSGVSTSYDQYVTRVEVSLPVNGTTNLSTLYGLQSSGCYRLFDLSDPRTSATLWVKHNATNVDPDVRVDSNSSLLSVVKNTSGKLNVYIENYLVQLQNKTSATVNLKLYKEV